MFAARLLKAGVAAVFGLTLVVGGAQAASVSSQLFLGFTNQWSDNSAEAIVIDPNGNGFLDLGDSLEGILTINTVENLDVVVPTNSLGLGTNNELSGVFGIVVTSLSVLVDPDASCGGSAACVGGLSGDELAFYSFGPSAAFIAEFGASAGTMVILYEDPIAEYTRLGPTIPGLKALITDVPPVMELGFLAGAGNFWETSLITSDPGDATTTAAGVALGTFTAGLSLTGLNLLFGDNDLVPCSNPFGPQAGLYDFCASGSVLGTAGIVTPYQAFDNVDFVFHPVPEPGILGLFGIGLLGLGFFARRRRPS